MGKCQLNIKSIHHLALHLEISETQLLRIAASMQRHVRPFNQKKDSGGYRQLHDPAPVLKEIQRRINKRLLQTISLPDELHGGVPGKSTVTNASPHVRKDL